MNTLDYNEFAESCVKELQILQQKINEDYDLNRYKNWFYNQDTGLLTFNTEDVELNFKYFTVGSFSPSSNTWKWSWDNDTTLEKVKNQINIVKEFGIKNNFTKLTEGYFPSDEYEAWEFAAIAAKLTNGLSVYRPVSNNNLQFYLVITEFVDNETAQKIKNKYIECGVHEYKRTAFVCNHLLGGNKVGFNEAFETFEDMELGEDDDFQAWCDACEKVRLKEGEWNETSMAFADIKLVCEKCYFEKKELNLGDNVTHSVDSTGNLISSENKKPSLENSPTTNMTKQKIFFLITLAVIASFLIYGWVEILSTDTLATWRNYVAIALFAVLIVLYFKDFNKAVIATGIYLALGVGTALSLMPGVTIVTYGIGPLTTPPFNDLSFGLLILWSILNFNTLVNLYLDHKESKNKKR